MLTRKKIKSTDPCTAIPGWLPHPRGEALLRVLLHRPGRAQVQGLHQADPRQGAQRAWGRVASHMLRIQGREQSKNGSFSLYI